MNNSLENMRFLIDLVESKSADLYHGTSLEGADSILSDNYLEVNSWGAHDHPENVYPSTVKGSSDAASLTRNFDVAKRYSSSNGSGAVLVFDQGLLARDYGRRLRPVNIMPTHYSSSVSRTLGKEEELIYDGIKNVKKYLKQIYVFVDDPSELEDYDTLINNPLVKIVQGESPPTARMLTHQLNKHRSAK